MIYRMKKKKHQQQTVPVSLLYLKTTTNNFRKKVSVCKKRKSDIHVIFNMFFEEFEEKFHKP